MHRLDKVAEAFRLLGEALPDWPWLRIWEERVVREVARTERDNVR